MEIIFIIMPIAVFIVLLFFAALMWAIRSGQWDDLVRPAHRILDDDMEPVSERRVMAGKHTH